MGRRARHLNARHAGAELVLDARRITGIQSGDAVSNWSDASGYGRDATQSTTLKKPAYVVNSVGGNPAVEFNGNHCLSTPTYSASTDSITIVTLNLTGGGMVHERGDSFSTFGCVFLYIPSDVQLLVNANTGGVATSTKGVVSSPVPNFALGSGYRIARTQYNGTHASHSYTVSGSPVTLTNGSFTQDGSFSASLKQNIGSRNNNGSYSLSTVSRIASFIRLPFTQPPLVKRIEHSAAFSFKIQCS